LIAPHILAYESLVLIGHVFTWISSKVGSGKIIQRPPHLMLFSFVGREMGRRWKALDADSRQQYKDEYTRLRGDQQARKEVGRSV
jgi:hypothetical protein